MIKTPLANKLIFLLILLFSIDILSMQRDSEVNQILEATDFPVSPFYSLQPSQDLSFHYMKSVPHDFNIDDLDNIGDKKFFKNLSSEKIEKFLSQVNKKSDILKNNNLGCVDGVSGYHALFNTCCILKAITAKDKKKALDEMKNLYDFSEIIKLIGDKDLNHKICGADSNGKWRQLVIDYRKNKQILSWFNGITKDSNSRNNFELAVQAYNSCNKSLDASKCGLNFEDTTNGLNLEIDELKQIVDSDARMFSCDTKPKNFSIVNQALVMRDFDYWDSKIMPILEDFKIQKNKIHAFVLKEESNWYGLVINKSENIFQVFVIDSSNDQFLNRLILTETLKALEIYPKLNLNSSFNINDRRPVVCVPELNVESSNSIPVVKSDLSYISDLISVPTITRSDFSGDLPEEVENIINELLDPQQDPLAKNILLLHGPSGTGKTTIARTISGVTNRFLIEKNGGGFGNEYGNSGYRSIEQLFELAANCGRPCVIFIDEIDALTSRKSDANNIEYKKTLMFLLSKLDQCDGNKSIFLVFATNDLDGLDDAVNNRVSRRMLVDYPDAKARLKFLEFYKSQLPKERVRFDNSVLTSVANLSKEFSYRDLKEILRVAWDKARSNKRRFINNADIKKAFEDVNVRVISDRLNSKKCDQKEYRKMQNEGLMLQIESYKQSKWFNPQMTVSCVGLIISGCALYLQYKHGTGRNS